MDELPVAIAIQLREPLSHAHRKAVVSQVARGKQQVLGGGSSEAVLIAESEALVSVAPTEVVPAGVDSKLMMHPEFPRLPNKASQFARIGIATKDVFQVVNPVLQRPTHSCVAVWEHEADAAARRTPSYDDAFLRVVKKAKRKLAQTRSHDRGSRLVAIDTWVTEKLNELTIDPVEYVRREVTEQHDGATALLFLHRAWDGDVSRNRYSYGLLGGEDDPNVGRLVLALEEWEAGNLVPPGSVGDR